MEKMQQLQGLKNSGREIGRGAFATVIEMDYLGLKCAGKKLHTILLNEATTEQKKIMLDTFETECSILSSLHHPSIVQFLGVYTEKGSQLPVLVMEYLPITLSSCLEKYGLLPEPISYGILHDISLGLRYLHEQSPPVIHRDLSANNVLLTNGMNAKISDLGVAKILSASPEKVYQLTQTQVPGTPCYMPPEVMAAHPRYTTKLDVFSFGVLMVHVLSAEWPLPSPAFQDCPDGTMLPVSELDRRSQYLQKISPKHPLLEPIQLCLNNGPARRPEILTVEKVLGDIVSLQPNISMERRFAVAQEILTGPRLQMGSLVMQSGHPEKDYALLEQIGGGTLGCEYKAQDVKTGEFATLCMIKLQRAEDFTSIQQEIDILADCKHPNIIEFVKSYQRLGQVWIAMEYCGGGSLKDIYHRSHSGLNELQVAFVSREVLKGVHYLHGKNKMHQDIKAENILLTDGGDVKLSNFTNAAHLTRTKRKTVTGSPYWMAPEVIAVERRGGYNEKCDMWSVGITAIELAEAQPPFFYLQPVRAMQIITKRSYKPPELKHKNKWSENFHNFLRCALQKDPRRRPTAAELLMHEFVNRPALCAVLMLPLLKPSEAPPTKTPSHDSDYDDVINRAPSTAPLPGHGFIPEISRGSTLPASITSQESALSPTSGIVKKNTVKRVLSAPSIPTADSVKYTPSLSTPDSAEYDNPDESEDPPPPVPRRNPNRSRLTAPRIPPKQTQASKITIVDHPPPVPPRQNSQSSSLPPFPQSPPPPIPPRQRSRPPGMYHQANKWLGRGSTQ